jgi:integrase
MPRITKRSVEALCGSGSEYILWDNVLTGFGLGVYPSGGLSFIVQYRAAGRTRRIALGAPEIVSCAQARGEAKKLLSEAALGRDPAAERDKRRSSPVLSELADRYVRDVVEIKNKARSACEYQKLLRNLILPALGKRKVHEITRADIEAFRNAHRRTPFQANRALSVLSTMFRLAEEWGLRPENSNPTRRVERFREPRRERFLTDDEFSRLGGALAVIEERRPHWHAAVAAIRLLALTGCRRSEILRLRWEYVDWDRQELRLPDSKTGPRSVPLNAPAMLALRGLWENRQSANWVIPAQRKDAPLAAISEPWKAILEEAGLKDLRTHDLRHSYASAGARSGLSLPVIGALLGQSKTSTTERYTHFEADPVHAASRIVGDRIDAAMSQNSGAAVLRLHEVQR